METQFTPGQTIFTNKYQRGLVSSVDNEAKHCEVYLQGATEPVTLPFHKLNLFPANKPTAVNIVLTSFMEASGNIYSVMKKVGEWSKGFGASNKDIEDYRYLALSDYNNVRTVSENYLKGLRLE